MDLWGHDMVQGVGKMFRQNTLINNALLGKLPDDVDELMMTQFLRRYIAENLAKTTRVVFWFSDGIHRVSIAGSFLNGVAPDPDLKETTNPCRRRHPLSAVGRVLVLALLRGRLVHALLNLYWSVRGFFPESPKATATSRLEMYRIYESCLKATLPLHYQPLQFILR